MHLPFDIAQLLSIGTAFTQFSVANKKLAEEIGESRPNALGVANAIILEWQSRFEGLLHVDLPSWSSLAAFRAIADLNIPNAGSLPLFAGPAPTGPCGRDLNTVDDLRRAYDAYFKKNQDLYSGKFNVAGEAEAELLKLLGPDPERSIIEPTLGGQAGNIQWLLNTIGANGSGYVPYLTDRLKNISEIQGMEFLSFDSQGGLWRELRFCQPGIRATSPQSPVTAPSGGSFVITEKARRMILQLRGFRVLSETRQELPFKTVEFRRSGAPLGPALTVKDPRGAWPQISFFCRIWLESAMQRLVIDIASRDTLEKALRSPEGGGRIDRAVIGGLNAVFFDEYCTAFGSAQLRDIVIDQMRTLRDCDIGVGVEISAFDWNSANDRAYLDLLKALCAEGTIVALGVNGEDELPGMASGVSPFSVPAESISEAELQAASVDPKKPGFSYITWLRAKALAEYSGVRTLYVHTNQLDLILRRDADHGSLVHSQNAAFLGKGLVIAALMKRAYGAGWIKELKGIPLAVNAKAMVALWNFAVLFSRHYLKRLEEGSGAEDRLLRTGCWRNSDRQGYSLAVLPVLWPYVSEKEAQDMPDKLNPTGGGDMSFGSFFHLSGV